MFKGYLIPLLAFLFFNSCISKDKPSDKHSLRDSLLKQYFNYSDSFINRDNTVLAFDSTEYNYVLLKAYYRNDTNYLKWFLKKMTDDAKERTALKYNQYPILTKLFAEEAYQFNYGESFCQYGYNLTISQKNKIFVLHSVVAELNVDSSEFIIIKEHNRYLTEKNWDEFIEAIQYSDFWESKPYKEQLGFDGDFLSVAGVIRNRFDSSIRHTNYVSRRFVSNTALYKAYTILFKFSGITESCKH